MQAFYKRIKKMEAEIEALIDGVIDAAPASGRFDLMEHVAVPIPILVIAHILGVDESRLAEFREWSEGVILGLNPLRSAGADGAGWRRAQRSSRPTSPS
jgi:cytochrome P450